MVRILLADDHPLIRTGLHTTLEQVYSSFCRIRTLTTCHTQFLTFFENPIGSPDLSYRKPCTIVSLSSRR